MTTILVVDDERLLCNLLQEVLSCHGYEVCTAVSGRAGIEAFRHRRPQFTLLDLHLPDISGIEVLKKIREIDREAMVAILTGSASDKQEREARKLGVTDFLTKGLSTGDLITAVKDALKKQDRAALSPPPTKGATDLPSTVMCGGGSILVVDDELPICELLAEYLSQRGYHVSSAQDGPAALALVDKGHPQLIILDLHMPGMHGVEVLRKLREKKYKGGVIMLTGSRDEKLLKAALDLGSTDIVGKPFDLERIGLAVDVSLILTKRNSPSSFL